MLGKITWPWPWATARAEAALEPLAGIEGSGRGEKSSQKPQEQSSMPVELVDTSEESIHTGTWLFRVPVENLFKGFLIGGGVVSLNGRKLSLEQVCREGQLLGAWAALADVEARRCGKTLVTRWGRFGKIVDLTPLTWQGSGPLIEELLANAIAPWLTKSNHVELGALFLPVNEAAGLGQLAGVEPTILRWTPPSDADTISLTSKDGTSLKEETRVVKIPGAMVESMLEIDVDVWGTDGDVANDEAEVVGRIPEVLAGSSPAVAFRRLWRRNGTPPPHEQEQLVYNALVEKLDQSMEVRGWPNPDVWRCLRQEFPWAVDACQEIEKLAELAHFVKQPAFRLPPLLLVGSPGNGKTRLAERLAELAGVPRFAISGAGRNNGQVLLGLGRSWSRSQPSGLLQFVAKNGVANPLVVLDELDKSAQESNNGDLHSALLPFLEPESARAINDEFLLGDVDLSGLSWIATANDTSVLPGPLLSRFKVIEVGRPNGEHLQMLCESIRCELAKQFDVPVGNLPPITETDVARLRKQMGPSFSARQARMACEALLAEKARRGRLEMVR